MGACLKGSTTQSSPPIYLLAVRRIGGTSGKCRLGRQSGSVLAMAAAESHEGSGKQTEEKQQSDTIAATVDKVEDNRSDLDILLEEEEETSLYDKVS